MARTQALRLQLLGPFELTCGDGIVPLSRNSQRLIGFLGLQRSAVRRLQVAGTLWPEATDERALASLRSELWRLPATGRRVIETTSSALRLAPGVQVDLHRAESFARRLVGPGDPLGPVELAGSAVSELSCDLLPDWYEEWVVIEAELWRQLRMHALEALSVGLRESGLFSQALAAALRVVQAEPLRESGHAQLVQIHLAEGNQSEAVRAFENYRKLLARELGLEPTPRLRSLLPSMSSSRR